MSQQPRPEQLTPDTNAAGRKRKRPKNLNNTADHSTRATPRRQQRDSRSHLDSPVNGRPRASSPVEDSLDDARRARCRVESPSPPDRASLQSTELRGEEDDRLSSESGDDNARPRTLEELIDEPYWIAKGKVAGRMGEMFDSFRPILEQGMLRTPDVDLNSVHTSLENERYHSYQVICLVVPKLTETFDEAEEADLLGPALASVLHNLMRKGRSEARNTDVSTIKAGIFIWSTGVDWNPPAPKVRQDSGHKHPVCSRLLCPPNFTEVDMSDVQSGKLILTTDDLPRFLWAGCVRQPGRGTTFVGFLRGEILVVGYLAIHIGPGAARGDARSTRAGNASLHDVSFVTMEGIVYIAVLIHFGLSSQPNFSAGSEADGQFLYNDLYRTVLDTANKMSQMEKNDLINWWDEKIFPGVRRARRATANRRKTVIEEMEDELEAELQAKMGSRDGPQDGGSSTGQGITEQTQASGQQTMGCLSGESEAQDPGRAGAAGQASAAGVEAE